LFIFIILQTAHTLFERILLHSCLLSLYCLSHFGGLRSLNLNVLEFKKYESGGSLEPNGLVELYVYACWAHSMGP